MAHFELEQSSERPARIKVVGAGGGGGNALNNMIDDGLETVEFIAANTDLQALGRNKAPIKIQLGESLTKGLGAGGIPDVGRKAALEDMGRLGEALQGADMIFIACGLGGGTGTGSAPIIAQVAREVGALTVAVCTMPFHFEGRRRRRNAEEGLANLSQEVDTLIKIPNQKLLEIVDESVTVTEAFRMADQVLLGAVRGITELIQIPGEINVDFADVRSIMSCAGPALMGTGWGRGEHRAREAAEAAIHSPLLEDVGIEGATGVLINITGGPDLKLTEVSEAASIIETAAHEDANIIYGQIIHPDMGEQVKITVIATGFAPATAAQAVETTARQQNQRQVMQPAAAAYRASDRTVARAVKPTQRQECFQTAMPTLTHVQASMLTDAEIDIPTFIRKQTD